MRRLQDVSQDVRYGLRLLAKDGTFTLAVVVALALAIGLNTTVFTFINAALFKSLPFETPEQLMALGTRDDRGQARGVSYAELLDWRAVTRTFSALSAAVESPMNVSEPERAPERFRGAYLSANAFDLVRVAPILGRSFVADDERSGAAPVVMLSYEIWKRRWNSDPEILGRSIKVNDVSSIVVGILPDGFRYPGIAQMWQPLTLWPDLSSADRTARTLSVTGRLKEGVTLTQARTDFDGIADGLARQHPDTHRGISVTIAPPLEATRNSSKPILFALMTAVSFVLLIACANTANLLLARAAHRSREIAIRSSLGATRSRIVRQLLIESFILAGAAGVLGLVFSRCGVRYFGVAFDAIQPDGLVTPYWIDLSIDMTIFGFVAALCLGSSVLFGLAPALHVATTGATNVLKEGSRSVAGSIRTRRWTELLLIGELALTLVLLVGAGLLVRSFVRHYRTPVVVDTTGLFSARLALPLQKYDTLAKQHAFVERLEERLRSNATLASATIASQAPFSSVGGASRELQVEARPVPTGEPPPAVRYLYVGRDYSDTLRLRVADGRTFTATDGMAGQETAIVNQRLADRYFPGRSALGQRIRLSSPGTASASAPWLTIVGVLPSLPSLGFEPVDPAVAYVPVKAEAAPLRFVTVIARSAVGFAPAISRLRDDVRSIDADLPLYFIETTDDAVARTRFGLRLIGSLFVLLASIGLVLAAVGLYAITAYAVTQRTQEVGVRMALGAQRSQVLWLFMRRTVLQLAVGISVGGIGAMAVGQLVGGFLVGIGARDPLTLIVVATLLVAVSVVACFLPARRATCVDPIVALRYE